MAVTKATVRPDTVRIAVRCFGVSIAVECRPADAEAVSAHLPLGSEPLGSEPPGSEPLGSEPPGSEPLGSEPLGSEPPGSEPIDATDAEHRFLLMTEASDDHLFRILRGSRLKARAIALTPALKILQKEIHLCVAEHAKEHVFIHAGVVTYKNRCIIFPGYSRAGKSTLVWSLVQAGAVYYSDEYAIFDRNGRVYPFALPIALRNGSGERDRILPEHIGSDPLTPAVVAFARYKAGATWRPRELSPPATVLQLIRHSISIRSNPILVLPVLKTVSLECRAFSGLRGDPIQILDWLSTIHSEYY
jgi:hypothetical protein